MQCNHFIFLVLETPYSSLTQLQLSQRCSSHTHGTKKNQTGMASERQKLEEAPAPFKSLFWEHFSLAVKYNDERVKT